MLLTPPSLRPAGRPRPCCLSICSTAAASVSASGSICRPRLAPRCKRCHLLLNQRLDRHGLHLDQRLDGRRPRLASSLRQRCSCPTGGSTRRRLRLGQRLDDRRHHLSVSGTTYTTFASASGSTAPLLPHNLLNPRRLRLGQRLDNRQRCDCHLLTPLLRPAAQPPRCRLTNGSTAAISVLASVWPAARSPQPSPHPAAAFISTSSLTAAASVLASGSRLPPSSFCRWLRVALPRATAIPHPGVHVLNVTGHQFLLIQSL